MPSKKKLTVFFIVNSLVCLIIGAFLPVYFYDFFRPQEVDPNLTKFMEVYDLIKDEWYFLEDGDESEFIDRALSAMVNEQNSDQYLQYYPAPTSSETLYGIGVTVASYDGYLIVKEVSSSSPASKVGMKKDDIIIAVDNQSIFNMALSDVSNLILGPIGTEVKITCKSKQGDINNYIIKRNDYIKQSVFGSIEDGIGTIRITGFENGTANQVDNYLSVFKKNKVEDLIIDLRDNGGGYIYSFKEIADYFIEKNKELGTYIHKNQADNEISYTQSGVKYSFDTISIVINQNSASASESFTASMMDNLANVTVYGSNSYGKGIAQKNITFSDGSSLKYTYAEYLRPDKSVNNGVVHKIGIQPDKIVLDQGNYKILEEKTNSFAELKNNYQEYFNSLKNSDISEDDKRLCDKALLELETMNDKISFSDEVYHMLTRLQYDERQLGLEAQMNEIKQLIKG